MIRIVMAIALVLSLAACDTFGPVLSLLPGGGDKSLLERMEETGGVVDDKVIGNAVKGVPIYCKLPPAVRGNARDHINGQANIGGNKVGIWCVGDPALTLGPTAP